MSEDKGKDELEGPSAPFWMVTFSDMVTLLLTFFVMIVAMSEVEVKKFKEALSYFQGRTSVLSHDAVTPAMNQQLMTIEQSRDQAERYEELLKYLEENDLHNKLQVYLTENGLHLIIADSVMFNSGEAELIEPSRRVLRFLAGLLDERIEAVVVEGHTDNLPIQTLRYPSNWELSAMRAASVVRFLISQTTTFDASRYVAIGHGEYLPVDTDATPSGRARNRRVEIFLSWEPWQNSTRADVDPVQPLEWLEPEKE